MQTAIEFAAGRGHPDHPLLHRVYSPATRMPCTDFSPWLRERLADGDENAAVIYVLQVTEVDRRITVDFDFQTGTSTRAPNDARAWMDTWRKNAREVLDLPFTDLRGTTPGWELDLRTLLVMMRPNQINLTAGAMDPDAAAPKTLASAMVCHDVRFADPAATVSTANAKLRVWKEEGNLDWPEATVGEVSPPPLTDAPRVLYDLPLGTRSHLYDISLRRHDGPAVASWFTTFYRTRQIGCADDESHDLLIRHGLLRTVDDPDILWRANAQKLTIAQLRELLGHAGITVAKSARKAAVIEATSPIRDTVIVAAGNQRVLELTPEGERVLAWVNERVEATRKMWAAWCASHERSDLRDVFIGFDDIDIENIDVSDLDL